MRKEAREAVFALLYRDIFCDEKDDDLKTILYTEHSLSESDREFADRLYNTVNENKEYLLSIIADISKGFTINRIFPTDKCALYIGLCEMTYFDDVPNIVAIDEAVGLTKKYSDEKSPSFVNGILAEYKNRLEAEK